MTSDRAFSATPEKSLPGTASNLGRQGCLGPKSLIPAAASAGLCQEHESHWVDAISREFGVREGPYLGLPVNLVFGKPLVPRRPSRPSPASNLRCAFGMNTGVKSFLSTSR